MYREHFPIFKETVYLNSCSQGALSIEVRSAYEQYLRDWAELGSPWELWLERQEALRTDFAQFTGAAPDAVAMTASVSAGISALASALDFSGQRTRIVVSDFDFPTVGQIWHAQARRGAEVVHVPPDATGQQIPLAHFAHAIDERTRLVCIPHVCYFNGAMLDVAAIIELAHARGAWVLLDSYQALGTMPVDVASLGVDFLVGGTLKYLLGSPGLAFLYARPELISQLAPSCMGWLSQADIFAMDGHRNEPAPNARRFEAGSPPVPGIYAAQAGIELVQSIGVERIAAHIRELTGAIQEGAQQHGFSLATPTDPAHRGALVALRSLDVAQLVARLSEQGIITSSRDGNLRVSPHFYNTLDDVDRLMAVLVKHRDLLVRGSI